MNSLDHGHYGLSPALKLKTGIFVVGICGAARAGKDTTADFLCKTMGYEKIPLAKALKLEVMDLIHSQYGDVGPDLLDDKKVMRVLYQIWGGYKRNLDPSYWIEAVHNQGMPHLTQGRGIIVPDVRFRNEAAWIKQMNGVLIRVEKIGGTVLDGSLPCHISERGLDGYEGCDTSIVANDGDLSALYSGAATFFKGLPAVDR
jgi:hypothetical protein